MGIQICIKESFSIAGKEGSANGFPFLSRKAIKAGNPLVGFPALYFAIRMMLHIFF